MRLNTAAMNAAFSSLVLVPSVIRISSQTPARPVCASEWPAQKPVGRIDHLHLHGGDLRILVQDLGGQIARGLGNGRFEAGLGSAGCIGDSDHGHDDLLCSMAQT
jgi:hypothetical protein